MKRYHPATDQYQQCSWSVNLV
uniref:Uncharacterized protein n=1 Tax=Arundo donax TaxID=35708 RepID=A0A0A9B8G4_ARUDO